MSKLISFLGWAAALGLMLVLFTYSTRDTSEEKQYIQTFHSKYAVYAVPVPQDINFADEIPPLHDPDVLERLDREMHVNTYWQSNSLLLFKRANRFFPVIETILKEEGVPEDFKYLALIESGLTNVVSPAGAAGFWQFLKSTGREYGLEITDEVDERYNLEKATRAACQYLKEAKTKFGTWTMAAASYNMGMNGLSKQLERQKATNYYDLLLNSETARYVFRILAMKAIFENPKNYGFNYREEDLYAPFTVNVIQVDSSVAHFADFAKGFGISYKTLKRYNPWLRQNYLHNRLGKTYKIHIPILAATTKLDSTKI